MRDFFTWSPVPAGRWFGTRVRLHVTLLLFVAMAVLAAAARSINQGSALELERTLAWVALYFLALALHAAAHAATAAYLGIDHDDIQLSLLGELNTPGFTPRSREHVLAALAGPVVNGSVFLAAAVALRLIAGARFVSNPFGNASDPGAPVLLSGGYASPFTPVWVLGWFGYLNYLLMLLNLLPALPFDGGRMMRASFLGMLGGPRDAPLGVWAARFSTAILVAAGILRITIAHQLDGLVAIALGVTVELLLRRELHGFEEPAEFDEELFGYDFSEGYTSLEASPAKVRPRRENVIRRWRRRQLETRRARAAAQALADERRMDEILEKIHREGKGGLTPQEQRFLVTYSARLRERTRPRD